MILLNRPGYWKHDRWLAFHIDMIFTCLMDKDLEGGWGPFFLFSAFDLEAITYLFVAGVEYLLLILQITL